MFSAVCSAAKMASTSERQGGGPGAERPQGQPLSAEERRRQVMLGPLPGDFLQIDGNAAPDDRAAQQEAADHQTALALQQQLAPQLAPANATPAKQISITIIQAKLVKNYGMTRMDPYVRLRVGNCIYETHTASNGGKTPRWNKVINCLLYPGVTTLYLEIYDECSFSLDELIAWAHINIPPSVIQGEVHEDWYRLNGKQGDGMEGNINLLFSPTPTLPMVQMPYVATYPPVVMVPNTMMGYSPMTVYQAPAVVAGGQIPPANPVVAPQPALPPVVQLSDAEIDQIHEMFPKIEKEVIKSVSEANRGNKDATVNSLLQMSE